MATVLGEAFQSIAQALAQMQGAMWAMNEEMTRTDCAIGDIVRSLREQGASVDMLDRRMLMLEKRANALFIPDPECTHHSPPDACAYPCAAAAPAPVDAACINTCVHYCTAPPPPPPAHRNTCVYTCTTAAPPPAAHACPAAASVPSHASSACPTSVCPASTAQTSVKTTAPPPPSSAAPCTPSVASSQPTKRQAELGSRLVAAVECGRLKHVERLIKVGADVNYMAPGSDRSLLHRATEKGFASVASELLKHGANLGMRDQHGCTPLHIAADNDYSSHCVGLLLQAGADASSRDATGRTPLHYAASCGNEASAVALLAAGASKLAEDDRGKRPCNFAKTMCLRKLLQPPRTTRSRSRSRPRSDVRTRVIRKDSSRSAKDSRSLTKP